MKGRFTIGDSMDPIRLENNPTHIIITEEDETGTQISHPHIFSNNYDDHDGITFPSPPRPPSPSTNQNHYSSHNPSTSSNLMQDPHHSTTHLNTSPSMSRSQSAILSALRRPSQHLALSAAHAFMNQRKHLQSLFSDQGERLDTSDNEQHPDAEMIRKRRNRRTGDDAMTTVLSALYAKLLVVLGIAFPVTEIVSKTVRPFFYQGFYLYLYIGSIAFVLFTYGKRIKKKYFDPTANIRDRRFSIFSAEVNAPRYGSFYLRMGAVGFGIGSMVHSGLEFGRYFELKSNSDCYTDVLQAITPGTRMLLTLLQIQFIFLNSQNLDMNKQKYVSRFGLMHMIGTNLCEWLYVIVEETKHEILNLAGSHDIHQSSSHNNSTSADVLHAKYCSKGQIMGSLVDDASTILFPCTIEYSLICAVILYEMWKHIEMTGNKKKKRGNKDAEKPNKKVQIDVKPRLGKRRSTVNRLIDEKTIDSMKNIPQFKLIRPHKSGQQFTIDCSKSHHGLFAGILIIVLTIISLIMFFVLSQNSKDDEHMKYYKNIAAIQVKVVESILYLITIIVVIVAMYKLRDLTYKKKGGNEHSSIGLDSTLLVVAQTGMFIYCMFSIIGCYFTSYYQSDETQIDVKTQVTAGFLAEIFAFVQTCLQTMLVLDGSFRRCRNIDQTKKKPGREVITFLIIANMAMWSINSLEKSRAQFRPAHMEFYGEWAWTIITHISMPLAIFYRFHSTICLFEIWKSAYKIKAPHLNHY